MGVMVDLEAHCLPAATILDGIGVSWEWESPFLELLVPPSCSSSATVSASCAGDLGGLAPLWL